MPTDALRRARRVRLLTCDVDGVLTDGRIYVDDHGHETKAFSALDGVGIALLMRAGIAVAWITGALRMELGLAAEDCAHIGDDLPDLAIFDACGFAVTVPHAPPRVRERAHFVTARDGGAGAVREIADLILAAQGVRPDDASPPRAA